MSNVVVSAPSVKGSLNASPRSDPLPQGEMAATRVRVYPNEAETRRKAWLVNTRTSDSVPRKSLQPVLPLYIRRCQEKAWTVALQSRSNPDERAFVCYACKSWRCVGDCARANAAQWFARLKTSFERSPSWWVFVTLTMDPKRARSRKELYRQLSRAWGLFRKRVKFTYGYENFVLCVEMSERQGVPHVHAMIQSRELYSAVEREGAVRVHRWLKRSAMESGFGFKCHLSNARDRDAVSGYFVKAAGMSAELSDAGEKGQLPVDAPKGFRRIRASKGFIVPKLKSEKWTGQLLFHQVDEVTKVYQRQVQARAERVSRAAERLGRAQNIIIADSKTGELAVDLLGEALQRRRRRRRRRVVGEHAAACGPP